MDGYNRLCRLERIGDSHTQNGASPNSDLEELWRRIVFYIAVKNTDDHLRNHGFLLTNDGWRLSPAYDVNPVYFGTGLTLNISETDNATGANGKGFSKSPLNFDCNSGNIMPAL